MPEVDEHVDDHDVDETEETEELEGEIDTEDHDDADDEPIEGEESLGDPGKKALDRMKAKLKDEAARRRKAEADLAAARGEEVDPKLEEALSRANARIVKSEIKAAAKGVLNDPADAFKFLDLEQFEVDDDGNVDEELMAEAIAELVTEKPYLAAQGSRKQRGTADGGVRGKARPSQLTRADLARMSPEEINKARSEGRLNNILGITK